jgi:hypothetical protein
MPIYWSHLLVIQLKITKSCSAIFIFCSNNFKITKSSRVLSLCYCLSGGGEYRGAGYNLNFDPFAF